MYKMFFPSGNAEEFCDHVFRTFDMDKNGYIDFKVSLEIHFVFLLLKVKEIYIFIYILEYLHIYKDEEKNTMYSPVQTVNCV